MNNYAEVLSKVTSRKDDNKAESIPLNKQAKDKTYLKNWLWFPLHLSQRKILLIFIDLFLLNGALLLGLYLYQGLPFGHTLSTFQPIWFATLTLLWLIIASANNNYKVKRADRLSSSIFGIVKTLLLTGFIYNLLPIISPPFLTEPLLNLVIGALMFVMIVLWRVIYTTVLLQPIFQRRILIEGTGKAGRIIAKAIKEHNSSYEIIGYINGKTSKHGKKFKGISVLDNWTNLTKFVSDHSISDIVLTSSRKMHNSQVEAVLKCFEEGVRIVPMPELFEEITGRIPVEYIKKRWLITLPIDWDRRRLYMIVKRVMDIIVAGIGLILLTPAFLLLVIAIKLDSPGPIFYRPERLSRSGKPFRLWKLRTMVVNADSIGNPTFTAMNDHRITRVGHILRTLHLDELPQFINIIAGDMSLVGPRPERYVPELEEHIPYYRTRYAVKPGATGWALVNQGYAEGLENTLIKLQYDLYYIKHQSLSLDIRILCKSILHMLTMKGR